MAGLQSTPQIINFTTSGTTGTQTITSVSTANTVLRLVGFGTDIQGYTLLDGGIHWELTNSTTITWYKTSSAAINITLAVLEYTPGIIVSQEMTSVALSGSASGTDSITAINTAKYEIIPYGVTASSFTVPIEIFMCASWTLNSSTQTQLTFPTTYSGTITAYANVIQTA